MFCHPVLKLHSSSQLTRGSSPVSHQSADTDPQKTKSRRRKAAYPCNKQPIPFASQRPPVLSGLQHSAIFKGDASILTRGSIDAAAAAESSAPPFSQTLTFTLSRDEQWESHCVTMHREMTGNVNIYTCVNIGGAEAADECV